MARLHLEKRVGAEECEKQVQELLRVDRITVYRMLKDGRLKGLKVGSQWRVPEQTIEGLLSSGTPEPEPRPMAPSEVLPVHCLQVIQDLFAEILDVGPLTSDPQGQPLTGISNSCEFCDLILESPSGRQACIESWRRLTQTPKSDPQFAACHAGLQYARGRIELDGQLVGAQIAGQFYLHAPDEKEEVRRIEALAAIHEIVADHLQRAAIQLRRLDKETQSQIGQWLKKLAATFEIIVMERAISSNGSKTSRPSAPLKISETLGVDDVIEGHQLPRGPGGPLAMASLR